MRDIVERSGGEPVVVEAKWGEAFDPKQIEAALNSCRPRALALVHAETSTGVLQDLTGLSEMAHRRDALLIVDAVTSLGGHSVAVDRNGIDICYSGTQKCIGAPPRELSGCESHFRMVPAGHGEAAATSASSSS